jgi:hypothetical protein
MNELTVEGTKKTPGIDFNNYTGELILSGRSIPENSSRIYEPLLKWIKEYVKDPRLITNFRLKLEYYNSSSLIWFVKMINELAKINIKNSVLMIHLYIEKADYDMLDIIDMNDLINSLIKEKPHPDISLVVRIHSINSLGWTVNESMVMFALDNL